VGERGLKRDLSIDLFFVEVGGRRPVLDAAHAIDGARNEKQRRRERRFSAIAVPDDRDISNVRRVVDLHGRPPRRKAEG
jgi:hypothetical protein